MPGVVLRPAAPVARPRTSAKAVAAAVAVAALVTATSTRATGAEGVTAYEPLAFLVGHCWKGTFPDGKVTDEHCFSWIYGGKFVRDEHVVHKGAGQPDGFGESIYVWDAPSGQLQYLYIESAGGWRRVGRDAYDVVTEFRDGDRWCRGSPSTCRRWVGRELRRRGVLWAWCQRGVVWGGFW